MALTLIPVQLPATFGDAKEQVGDLLPDLVKELDGMQVKRGSTEFTPERKTRYLCFLAKFGQKHRAAQFAGVHTRTVWDARRNDNDFKEAEEQAFEMFREGLENEALRRAVDGWEEPVYQKGELVGTIHRFSERMLELLLKANLPEKYRENIKLDANVTGGVLVVAPQSADAEDWEKQYGSVASQGNGQTIEGVAEPAPAPVKQIGSE